MRACSMASGGVMFVPDEIQKATSQGQTERNPINYKTLLDDPSQESEKEFKGSVKAKSPKTKRNAA